MKRFAQISAVALLLLALSSQISFAQGGYHAGYGFGLGAQYGGFGNGCSNVGNFGFTTMSRQQPPYFAQFPPVYYSHIVARPYGVSPYAAPPGIQPVEMNLSVPAQAVTIANPYFQPTTLPASDVPPMPSEAPVAPMINENEAPTTAEPAVDEPSKLEQTPDLAAPVPPALDEKVDSLEEPAAKAPVTKAPAKKLPAKKAPAKKNPKRKV